MLFSLEKAIWLSMNFNKISRKIICVFLKGNKESNWSSTISLKGMFWTGKGIDEELHFGKDRAPISSSSRTSRKRIGSDGVYSSINCLISRLRMGFFALIEVRVRRFAVQKYRKKRFGEMYLERNIFEYWQ